MAAAITARAAPRRALTEIRVETLKRYGIDANLTPRFPDPVEREAAIRKTAAEWAAKWDAHSLIILRRALLGFDTRPDFARIKAKIVLHVVPHRQSVPAQDRARE